SVESLNIMRSPAAPLLVILVAMLGLVITEFVSPTNRHIPAQPGEAIQKLALLEAMLEDYRGWSGEYPEQLMHLSIRFEGVDSGALELALSDPWGTEFAYRRTDIGFDLYSFGKDRKDNKSSGDDIAVGAIRPSCSYYEAYCETPVADGLKFGMAILLVAGVCSLLLYYAALSIWRILGHAT
ncbi:MAG: type II secretion system protein GspG, partial [Cyanobacteria bacterium J06648_11]